MGDITNGNLLNFIYLGTGKTPSNIDGGAKDSDIIFYSGKNQIIVNGVVFGVTDAQAAAITAATSDIEALNSRVEMSHELSVTILQILRDTHSKLDGATLGAQGFTGGQGINDVNGVQVSNAFDAINALNTYIGSIETQLNNTNTGVSTVNSQGPDDSGNVLLNGSHINTTSDAGSMFGTQSIDTAFAGVQSNIDGIQGRIQSEETARAAAISGVQGEVGAEKTARETAITGVQTQFNNKIAIEGTQSVKEYVDAQAQAALSGAQATAKAYVDDLAGFDWTGAGQTVQNIINELSEGGVPEFDTVVDKVRGDFSYEGAPEGSQSIKGYIDHVVGNANSGAQGSASSAEENAKAYTDQQVAAGIQGLDGVQGDADPNNFVTVQVTEVDGIISGVQVTSNDIASHTALTNATGRITDVENQLKWIVV